MKMMLEFLNIYFWGYKKKLNNFFIFLITKWKIPKIWKKVKTHALQKKPIIFWFF